MKVRGIIIELSIKEAKEVMKELVEYIGETNPALTELELIIDNTLRPIET